MTDNLEERAAKLAARAGVSLNGSGETSHLRVAHPVLAPEAFHGLAGDIVRVLEPHSEADPAALLVTTLATFGAMVGAGPHALADGAPHPARIWPLIVGNTSKSRKGSSWAQGQRVPAGADPKFMAERVLGGFGSGEALVDACASRNGDEKPDPRLLVVESEFARVLAVSKREGSTLSTLMRQAWDGSRLQVRSRAGTAVANEAHVVVLGQITKTELLARVAESDVHGGLLNRFLIVAAQRSKLLPSGGNLDDADLTDLIRNFASFATQARKVGIIRRTPGAEDCWAEIYEHLADDDPGGLLGAVIARDSAQMLRLSVAYALFDGCRQVDVPHILAAQAVWDYCRTSAALIFGELTGDPIADRIMAELQAAPHGLSATDLSKLLGTHIKAERIEIAKSQLIERGLAKEAKKSTTRGRPTIVLHLAEKAKEAKEVSADAPTSDPLQPTDEDFDRFLGDEIDALADECGEQSEQRSADETVALLVEKARATARPAPLRASTVVPAASVAPPPEPLREPPSRPVTRRRPKGRR
jgi:hypothetical protein